MNTSPPLVSVGIPTFNRAKKLAKCLESVLQQTYHNIEIIVSDNMSSDATPDVCYEFEHRDRGVKIFRQSKNIGSIPNFNFVRDKSKGEYFMWLGDDDWIDPDFIQSCVIFLENNLDYIAAGGRTIYYRENSLKFDGVTLSIKSKEPGVRMLDIMEQIVDAGTFYSLYRVKLAKEISFLNAWGADYYFLCEAAYYGKIETLVDVSCHRIDNSHLRSINETILTEDNSMQAGQDQDPYGTIASVLFWRIAVNSKTFSQLQDWDLLLVACRIVDVVSERWTITGQVDLLQIAINSLFEQDLLSEFKRLRTLILIEWLKVSNGNDPGNWGQMSPVLDVFTKLGFSRNDTNPEERILLSNLIKSSKSITVPVFKNEVEKVMELFS